MAIVVITCTVTLYKKFLKEVENKLSRGED